MSATTAPSGTPGAGASVQPTTGTYSPLYTVDASKKGGTLTTALTVDISTFHPYGTTSYTDISVVQPLIYSGGLLTRDAKTSLLVCQTCQSYEVSSDYKTVTFKCALT